MSLLDRYILSNVVRGTGLVLMVLLALSSFVGFVGQVDDVGQGEYSTAEAFVYVLLTLPSLAYQMAPIATLLGALLGLGNLAAHSELIVMRAAGVSPWRLARSVLLAGVILAILASALGELIAPPAEAYAKRSRTMSIHKELNMDRGQSGWIRDGELVINIEQLIEEDRTGGIYVFTLHENRELASIVRARAARFGAQGGWVLEDAHKTEFTDGRIAAETLPRLKQATKLSPELLGLSIVDPDILSSRALAEYIRYLRSNELNSDRYITAFWSRLATIVSVVIMAALALPFVFGSLRSSGAGQRVFVGVLIGAGYFLVNRLIANSGAVYGLDPALTAWLPTLVLGSVTVIAVSRIR